MTKSTSTRNSSRTSRQDNEARAEEDVAFVERLAQLLREHDLAELEVTREYGEDDELTVRLSRYAATAAPVAPMAPIPTLPSPPPALAAPAEAAPAPAVSNDDPAAHPGCVTSPMVGTVYLKPEPGAEDFVKVGDTVTTGQTLLIVEAMKTMNHIPSPKDGKVTQVLVANEQPVEFGAPMVIIE